MPLQATCDARQFLMSFPGLLSHQLVCVVADSAASCFDRAFVVRHGLHEYGATGSVSVAGQTSLPVSNFLPERAKCQASSDVCHCFIQSSFACGVGSELAEVT
ncbi:TPA: hypothetical protein ACH3X1_014286 [Trebouxia sp. C0004]